MPHVNIAIATPDSLINWIQQRRTYVRLASAFHEVMIV